MEDGATVELVLLEGGRAKDPSAEDPRGRADLRLVPEPASELQAALEETVAAARKVRREIEERIASALDDLVRARAPEPSPS
jgi:hypothetical protein